MADLKKKAAQDFVKYWTGKGYEKGESQSFWNMLLRTVLGVENPETFIEYEDKVMMDKGSGFIDGYIPSTKVLIEQKSLNKNLRAGIKQSDGTLLSPFQQAKRYIVDMPVDRHPKYVITCNFQEFNIYDMNKPNSDPEILYLKDLPKEYYRLSFITETENIHIKKEMELSLKAGEIVGLLYSSFASQYKDLSRKHSVESLNKLCVRIVFCLYAEDTGLFNSKNQFCNYINRYDVKFLRQALIELFKVLDTPLQERDNYYFNEDLKDFPYVNGGLFKDEIEIPMITEEIKTLLIIKASENFNWAEISPTIFGAVFESTLNPETRRSGGMHYTSIENIHKVIDPLFLDDLKKEFEQISKCKIRVQLIEKLLNFQKKLGKINVLDPACGSGNFLTETYLSLRKLENECIRLRFADGGQNSLDVENDTIFVTIHQFYGIEINDFAVVVAKTALWIAESQMLRDTMLILSRNMEFLPLKVYSNIVEGNALTADWNTVVPKEKLSYIIGNPPFSGARIMGNEQKKEIFSLFNSIKGAGNLDYVCGWYKKAPEFIKGTDIQVSLVSTNSITQGEQVSLLWKKLIEEGIKINFAYRTFKWDSESNQKAHVYCVIIGFSYKDNKEKFIFEQNRKIKANNINPYLIDGPDIMIESREKPICESPLIGIGNQPIDGGNYLFTKDEMEEFIKKDPQSEKYFKKWVGSDEFINRYYRYCLWLGDTSPSEIIKMPECLKRVNAVKKFRQESKRKSTLKLAEKPTRFQVENFSESSYLIIPRVSSEKRRYVPIGFMQKDTLASDSVHIVKDACLYHFGILTSNVHMAWMRVACGRLKSDYRYSKDIVYNNFPWPEPTEKQKKWIENTAQRILDARAMYPDSSLAELYGENSYLFSELIKAHQENDKAVMDAYGFDYKTISESECVSELMKMYEKLVLKETK